MAVTGAASNVMLRASKTGISNELPSASVKRTLPLSSSVSTFWKSVLLTSSASTGLPSLPVNRSPLTVQKPSASMPIVGGTPPTGHHLARGVQ